MICTSWIPEIVEGARRGGKPDAALEAHLSVCGECQERWKAEGELSSHFRVMRIHAQARRPDSAGQTLDFRGQMLMREFARRQKATRWTPTWQWGLAAAAALLLSIGLGREIGVRTRHVATRPEIVRPAAVHRNTNGAALYEAAAWETSADAGALSSDEFIAVPYSAPLATGEIVRVVRTDLYPGALASMGIDVNPAWAGEMSAEIVVGEDGFPRAVRLADSAQN
ncbi:MAG TPA: hypothetical protein VG273_09110 [Bryobacteraceae bacterium]|jgi:hypothetical protein|nr:hypothetical protein [Bryobacteraceae bacterium]